MNYCLIGSLIGVGLLAMMFVATSQPDNAPLMVNLILTPDIPASFSKDDISSQQSNLKGLYKLISIENLTSTLFLTQDVSSEMRARLGSIGLYSGFEYGISGNNSEEKLSQKSYSEQLAILNESIVRAEACAICGQNEIIVKGFMPPSFDQNENTYKALDALGIEYDTGFQSGIIFAQDHEKDVWPYKLEGYNLYAVPVSTFDFSGKKMPLDDKFAYENGLTSSQWHDLLVAKLNEASIKGEPVVISLSTSVSGSGEYFDVLKKFIDSAKSKDAAFVTTYELVTVSRTGIYESPEIASKSECTTCDKNENRTNPVITQNNTPSEINVTMG